MARAGNRVPYIYVQTPNPDAEAYLRADDPAYVRQQGLQVDNVYILHHLFTNPVCLLLDPLLGVDKPEYQRYVEKTRKDKRLQDVIGQVLRDDAIQQMLRAASKEEAQRRRNFRNATNKQQSITSFYKAVRCDHLF